MALLCLLVGAGWAVPATPAGAASTLGWSSPVQPAGTLALTGVSCASRSLCVAVGHGGVALVSTDPAAGSGASWREVDIPGGGELSGVSCPTGGLCIAVDEAGKAFVSSSPATSWVPVTIDGTTALTGISCASTALCVAVDHEGRALLSTDPAAIGGGWHASTIDGGTPLTGVSCAPGGPCAAVDGGGAAIVSADPADTGWYKRTVAFAGLTAVACYDATRACVAVDADGEALVGVDPEAGALATWSTTAFDALGSPAQLAIDCDAATLCVAVDGAGKSLASDDATAVPPTWSGIAGTPNGLTDVSCVAEGICVAVGSDGQVVTALTPGPSATTKPASEIQHTTALLTGAVDPQDTALDTCSFEYGTTTSYGATAPCASLPTGSGQEPVSTALSGLAPGTTYYYRLVVATAAGAAEGGAESFRTVPAAIVEPHPSIRGIPAPGQRLTCDPGVGATTGVVLTYAWLRNGQTIAGTEEPTYGVSPEDVSNALQCRVTATTAEGSRTATSAFVTVPAGGLGTISETTVGAPRVSRDSVSVPVKCSAQADGSCRIQLSLTVQETLNGKRVLAVAARTRRTTVTIGSRSVRLKPGQQATVTVWPDAAGLRLLASMHRLQARLSVSGTVLGAISAALKSATVTLLAPPRPISRKPAHGHRSARGARRARASRGHDSGGHRATRARDLSRHARPALRSPISARASGGGATPVSVLAPTPYMGWDTYFAFGANYDEASVLEQASELKTRGLERAGYRYVWLDVGWWKGARSATGEIEVNPTQWPHGMLWLTSTLHAAGFKVGLYTDAGTQGCGGPHEGSYGHYQQDVDTFAAWGFDAIKVDFCGGIRQGLSPATAYAQFHEAIVHNASHRPMLLSICDYLQPGQFEPENGNPGFASSAFDSYTFGPSVGNSWRTDTDVGVPGNVQFSSVLRNLDADAAQPQAAGPGHWNDPDYLGPDQGMSDAQFRTQFSMWAMLAAPLMVSADMVSLTNTSLATLTDRAVIAVDQDPAGLQARLLGASGNGEVWVKPLADGDRAVALLNRGAGTLQISTSTGAIEMPAAGGYEVRNLWTGAVSRVAAGAAIGASVPADSTVLLRVSPT